MLPSPPIWIELSRASQTSCRGYSTSATEITERSCAGQGCIRFTRSSPQPWAVRRLVYADQRLIAGREVDDPQAGGAEDARDTAHCRDQTAAARRGPASRGLSLQTRRGADKRYLTGKACR